MEQTPGSPWELGGNQHLIAGTHNHAHKQPVILCDTTPPPPPELSIIHNLKTNEVLYLANSFPPFTGYIQLPRAVVEKNQGII